MCIRDSDRGVEKEEKEIVRDSIKEVLREGIDVSDKFPLIDVGSIWKEGDFGRVEWYLEKAGKRIGSYGVQYNAASILALCNQEPYQKIQPHIDIGIVSVDLYSEGLNFIYGITSPLFCLPPFWNLPAGSIISTFRIKKWFRENYLPVLWNISLHELGHIYGLPLRRYNVEMSLGRHCIRGDCVMGQCNVEREILWENEGKTEKRFISAEEIAVKSFIRKWNTGSAFCSDCREDLERSKRYWIKSPFNEEI